MASDTTTMEGMILQLAVAQARRDALVSAIEVCREHANTYSDQNTKWALIAAGSAINALINAAPQGGQVQQAPSSNGSGLTPLPASAVPDGIPELPPEPQAIKELRYGELLSPAGYADATGYIDALRTLAEQLRAGWTEANSRYEWMKDKHAKALTHAANLGDKLERAEAECERLREDAEQALRVAAGMLSTYPPYSDQHPQFALSSLRMAIHAARKDRT